MTTGKRGLSAVLIVLAMSVAATIYAAAASADPSHNIQDPVSLTCSDSTSFVVSPGTVTNRSHQAFVVDWSSILVAKYLAFTDATGTQVFFDTGRGLRTHHLLGRCRRRLHDHRPRLRHPAELTVRSRGMSGGANATAAHRLCCSRHRERFRAD